VRDSNDLGVRIDQLDRQGLPVVKSVCKVLEMTEYRCAAKHYTEPFGGVPFDRAVVDLLSYRIEVWAAVRLV
jgi:hypothetical protein